jgi:dihydrofolate reductase
METKLIVACDDDNGIGKGSSIPWKCRADMRSFRRLTTGTYTRNAFTYPSTIIMGRKTWDTIPGRPLKNRVSAVISRGERPWGVPSEVDWSENLLSVLNRARHNGSPVAWIIGGAEIYALALELGLVDEIIITRISGTHGCDTFFPVIHLDDFRLVETLGTGSGYRIERMTHD